MPSPSSTTRRRVDETLQSPMNVNVADRLTVVAAQMPEAVAVACPGRGDAAGRNCYQTCTFRQLEDDALSLARGLASMGVQRGMKLVLLAPPSVEFVKLVFALLRSGATMVLVDPGMGRRHLVRCISAAQPDGFIAVGVGQAVRTLLRGQFPKARFNVTVGHRWFWGGATYRQLLENGKRSDEDSPKTSADDSAAIIFTSGSTGPPKGVLYTHRMFDAQAADIASAYALGPGGADLSCFALFGLFNSVMGVTTVFPDMEFSRPASVQPKKLLAAARDWQVTQAFASPAVWNKVSRYCENTGDRIPTLRSVFSCGAPVPADVIRRTLACVHGEAKMHTPYGATEALPVASIEARQVLCETAEQTDRGAGVCVGRKFDSIEWQVISISDDAFATIDDVEPLPNGEIGELIVRGPQVSPTYCATVPDGAGADKALRSRDETKSPSVNHLAKITDGDDVWHRLGDVGYCDRDGRFWYCGRKNHRVVTRNGALYTIPIESIFNRHPHVQRCALVGVGTRENQTPVVVIQSNHDLLWGAPRPRRLRGRSQVAWRTLVAELRQLSAECPAAANVDHFLLHRSLPVDVRHNSKINREQLAEWAAKQGD